jgi:hypothetical protein
MRRMRFTGASICAVVLLGVGAGGAMAGERTGTGQNTGAVNHAGSICAFSGLEDYETPHDQVALVTPGTVQHPAPGDLHGGDNACKGYASAK